MRTTSSERSCTSTTLNYYARKGSWRGLELNARVTVRILLDPSVRPTASAYGLLGWLLEGSFITDMGGWERSAGARDCDEPGEREAQGSRAAAWRRRPQGGM